MDRRTLTKRLLTVATLATATGRAAVGAPIEASEPKKIQGRDGSRFRIRVLAFDGADEIDFTAPMRVFGFVATQRPGVDLALVTLQPRSVVKGAFGMSVAPDGVLDDVPDLLIVPGGGWVTGAGQGVRAEIGNGALLNAIRASHQGGAIVAGACTGAMALAAAGLLDGRPATTHHNALPDLRRTKAQVVEARVVDDKDVLTCGGVTSTFDLALWIVERFWGATLADRSTDYLEHSRSLDVLHR
ncbi:DJ-1/PfpI family protein [Methylosinus sp. Sm6]|uniref:DJ-1/PfpI family protein n=1 Tax=Methylosinus sp. Sm6 TaxID=2866948 RepID=UPI001C9A2AE2|nr:DJ-1/PfpI family protein [Methylosinus sp. Sm6]MBY6240802.1 DJ-1/PfpI family protein [Methylosinus sp. Sm6]